jgi:ATP synthase protein I
MSSRQSDANMLGTAWELSAGLLSFVVAIAIGWWFGGVLDRSFGTAPWLTDLFTALGLVAGVLNVYRTVSRAMRSSRGQGPPPAQGPGPESGGG